MTEHAAPVPGAVTAVLWDMDGVLADTETVLFEAEQIAFAAYGVDLTPEFKRRFIGRGGHEVIAAMVEALGIDADVEDLARRKLDAYAGRLAFLEGFPQTAAMVRAFHAAEVPQAVASGSPAAAIRAALHLIGLDRLLTTVVSADEVAAGKPAPDVFLEAARRLGVEPAQCLVVEDAVPGVLAARAAGMHCVAIPSVTDPLDPRFEQADLLIRGGMDAVDPDATVRWALGEAR
ncbi:HAD family hydrolase [Cellulomonas soli]